VLFIDARKLGRFVDATHRDPSDEEIGRIARTYHAWRGEPGAGKHADVPGFCKSATAEGVASHGHVLPPGRHVWAEATDEDGEPFGERMGRLADQLEAQFSESARLEDVIRRILAQVVAND
jgi:type I restriction enzyme M protein